MDLAAWTCCTDTQDPPGWVRLIVGANISVRCAEESAVSLTRIISLLCAPSAAWGGI